MAETSSAFHLLHPKVQRWLWRQGWEALRDLQEASIPILLGGEEDVVIAASTASGKTEAAFLPILTEDGGRSGRQRAGALSEPPQGADQRSVRPPGAALRRARRSGGTAGTGTWPPRSKKKLLDPARGRPDHHPGVAGSPVRAPGAEGALAVRSPRLRRRRRAARLHRLRARAAAPVAAAPGGARRPPAGAPDRALGDARRPFPRLRVPASRGEGRPCAGSSRRGSARS